MIFDPLHTQICVDKESLGIGLLERNEIRSEIAEQVLATVQKPTCIYEDAKDSNIRYYIGYLNNLSTFITCKVIYKDSIWLLEDTFYNNGPLNERIVAFGKLLYAK